MVHGSASLLFFLLSGSNSNMCWSHDLDVTSAARETWGSQDLSSTERLIWKVTGQHTDC